jgi:plastocyanin
MAPLTGHAAQPARPHAGRAHTVTIDSMRFSPATITVHRGDRITWINNDPLPHTVTATDGKFDSHPIAPGGSWTYVARKAGEYDYLCTLHVNMKGRIVVR